MQGMSPINLDANAVMMRLLLFIERKIKGEKHV